MTANWRWPRLALAGICAFPALVNAQNAAESPEQEVMAIASDYQTNQGYYTLLERTPAMIGDGFFGSAKPIRGSYVIDRLFVAANDLDAPAVLPPGNQQLNISEAGPVGVFSSTVISAQQIQTLLRNGQPLPPVVLVGQVNDNATLTTTLTITQIQTQLAGTAEAYDIIGIAPPPGSYTTDVNGIFLVRNGGGGITTFNAAASGAFLQAGADSLNGGEDLDAFYFYEYAINVGIESPLAAARRSGTG